MHAAVAADGSAVTAGLFNWDEWKHPRDMSGQFIEVGDSINVTMPSGGKMRGKVLEVNKQGVVVGVWSERLGLSHPTSVLTVQPKSIEVAPESLGRLNNGGILPNGVAVNDMPSIADDRLDMDRPGGFDTPLPPLQFTAPDPNDPLAADKAELADLEELERESVRMSYVDRNRLAELRARING